MVEDTSDWLKKQQAASRKTRIIVSTVGIIVLFGVIASVIYALVHKGTLEGGTANSNGSGSGSGNGNSGPGGQGNANGKKGYFTNDGKPVNLTITPDPRLHASFYGMNYGPILALYPWCTNTLGDTIEDIKMLSQLTKKIRLYGMDCNACNYTLQAIKLLGLDIKIIPTVWVDNNMTTYQRQYDDLFANLQEHGIDNIDGISVGNEVLFRKDINATDLWARIADVKSKINQMFPNSNVPVFTSDIGSNVNQDFVTHTDVAFANVHPYFANASVDTAANWTFQFFKSFDEDPAAQQEKQAVISEIGWPTNGTAQPPAIPSVANLQTFLQSFICQANALQKKYYYFESFDTPWKTAYFTVLEGSWGLFNTDRSFKQGVTIPDCQPPTLGLTDPPTITS